MRKIIIFFTLISSLFTIHCSAQVPELWGITVGGSLGGGVIFKINGDGSGFSNPSIFPLTIGQPTYNGLSMFNNNGKLYATSEAGGINGIGTIICFDTLTNIISAVHYFSYTDSVGVHPNSNLLLANDNKFYGTTEQGGLTDTGGIYSFDYINNIYADIHNFTDTEGRCDNNLMQATNGIIYGTTSYTNITGEYGVLFSCNPVNLLYSNLYYFDNTVINNGSSSHTLVQATNGLLFGLSEGNGNVNHGRIYSYNITTNTCNLDLYNFANSTLGRNPCGKLLQATNGLFYGMTSEGGANSIGVIYSFNPIDSVYTKLYDFNTPTGGFPNGSFIQASDGKLYATTVVGGINNAGVVFRFDIITNIYTDIHDFDFTDGEHPPGDLIEVKCISHLLTSSNTNICQGSTTVLHANGATSFAWQPGNFTDTIITVSPTITTSYLVTGILGGCSKTDTIIVTVNSNPTTVITGDSIFCSGSNLALSTSSFASYNWSTGSTTQNITVDSANTYIVTVTDGNGCTATASRVVTVNVTPTAVFTANDTIGCSPLSVDFINSSSNATSYEWHFGTNDSSSVTNPIYDYTTSGNYTITLIAYGAGGCSDTMIRSNYITIISLPTITSSFTASPLSGCNPLIVTFNNTSTNGITYLWNFGDNNTDTVNSPTHIYDSSGIFTVKLLTIDSAYCGVVTDTSTTTITVNPQAHALFYADSLTGCSPLLVNFINGSSNATSYYWDLGNNNHSTVTNPSFIYDSSGIYTITLIAYSTGGCNDTMVQSNYITILGLPTVTSSFVADTLSGCNPITINFINNSINGITYLWDFGDSITATTINATHVYNDSGTFTITLIATNNSPCGVVKDTFIQQSLIRVDEPIKVTSDFSAEPLTGCSPLVVNFTNSSINGASYYWFFGDGGFDSIKNPIHIFDSGSYHVYLIAYNNTNRCINAPDSAGLLITVENCELSIPNTFTPNGDGKNDFFDIIADGYTKFHLIIFDRWGLKIFESSNVANQWNGKVNNTGGDCADGTYYYIFTANDLTGKALSLKGFITLIR